MTRATWNWIGLLILSGSLAVYLLGNDAVGLIDRDEPRYAQTSRQMLASGDWVVPRFLDTIRTAKPAGIYWCQAACMAIFGDNAFAARLPSALAMVATLALLIGAVTREAGANRGLWTAFILGTSALALAAAKMSLTDSVLLLCIVLGQLCLYRLWRYGVDIRAVLMLGLAIGLGGLIKGPVALGVHACTLLALPLLRPRREATAFQSPLRADTDFPLIVPIVLGIAFMVVFPWLIAVHLRAPEFLATSIGHDVIARVRSGHEGHRGPPGLYLVLVWGTWLPWSLLLPAALVTAWRNRHLPTTRFALAALVGPWVMFELIVGKLPHYVLPTYPALAYLTADLLIRAQRRSVGDLATRAFTLAAIGWGILLAGLGLVPAIGVLLLEPDARTMRLWTVAGAIAAVGLVTAGATIRRFRARRALSAARAMGGGTVGMLLLLWAGFLPVFQPLRVSQNVAQLIIDHGGRGQDGYMIDYKEPSLAFHQGGGLREQRERDYLRHADPATYPTWLVLTQRVWEETEPAQQAAWDEIGRVHGIAYAGRGKRVEVIVLRRHDATVPPVP